MDRRRKARRLVLSHTLSLPRVFDVSFSGRHLRFLPSIYLLWTECRLDSFDAYREAREKQEREEYERNNPKISQQFADLKTFPSHRIGRGLGQYTRSW